MRNLACSTITALLCVLFLVVGGCVQEPTGHEPDFLSEGEEKAPIHDTVPDIPEIIVTQLGKSFTISLVSNPTTGYLWQAQFDREHLELINNDFVTNSNLIGAPGVQTFEIKAIKQGHTELRMIYKRSWEDEFAEKRVIPVQITGGEP